MTTGPLIKSNDDDNSFAIASRSVLFIVLMRCMDDKARCDNAVVLLTTHVALMENWLLNEGEEGGEGGPDVHRGRIRHVDVDDDVDGKKCKNDDDDDEDDEDDEEQRLTEDDARRRIIPLSRRGRLLMN
jgi:hypothetical protein